MRKKDFAHDVTFQRNVTADLVMLLYSQARTSFLGTFIVATFLTYALHDSIPHHILYSWYILLLAVNVIRAIVVKYYLSHPPLPEHCVFWKDLFVFMTLIGGFCWALVGILFNPSESIQISFISFSLAGITAAAIPFIAGSRAACISFIVPTLAPFALSNLMHANQMQKVFGIVTLLYLVMLLITAFRTHKAIFHAVSLKFENIELLKNLTLAKTEVDIVNRSLQDEVTERRQIEQRLRESEEQYRLVTDALPALISYIDKDYIFKFNNKVYEEWFNKPIDEITGQSIKSILDATTVEIFAEYLSQINNKKQVTYETIMKFPNNKERFVSVTLIPHMNDDVIEGVFSLISDMTPRINYLSNHDTLTDLPNRTLFNVKLSHALQEAGEQKERVAVLYLDLDNFKNINDTHGHDVGDSLLIKITERLKPFLHEEDVLARLGGDEYGIILENVILEDVISLAKNICDSFSLPFNLKEHQTFITTSIGISIFPDDGIDMQILLKNVDMAIHRAKERGKNTFEFYTQEMNEKITRRSSIESNIREALEKDEFIVYYQPVVDLTLNRITSLEALIRWEHPTLGFIPPSEFIPVAEDTGLIVPIGEWVLKEACKHNILLEKQDDKKLRIAVNISARQFKEGNVIYTVKKILDESGLSGDRLTLELTESMIMQDVAQSSAVINSLKDLGIFISIDDFGTGYSSLNYLRRFPIDTIKIDRSFITEINQADKKSEDAAAIVTAIITMAHSLKMKVVAEGVEEDEQFRFLKENGCDQIQGYIISPALAPQKIIEFLKAEKTENDFLNLHKFNNISYKHFPLDN